MRALAWAGLCFASGLSCVPVLPVCLTRGDCATLEACVDGRCLAICTATDSLHCAHENGPALLEVGACPALQITEDVALASASCLEIDDAALTWTPVSARLDVRRGERFVATVLADRALEPEYPDVLALGLDKLLPAEEASPPILRVGREDLRTLALADAQGAMRPLVDWRYEDASIHEFSARPFNPIERLRAGTPVVSASGAVLGLATNLVDGRVSGVALFSERTDTFLATAGDRAFCATGTTASADGRFRKLYSWRYHLEGRDYPLYVTGSDGAWKGCRPGRDKFGGFTYARFEGWLPTPDGSPPNEPSRPIFLRLNRNNQLWVTSTDLPPDFPPDSDPRRQGYVYKAPGPDRIPLIIYWSPSDKEFWTTTDTVAPVREGWRDARPGTPNGYILSPRAAL